MPTSTRQQGQQVVSYRQVGFANRWTCGHTFTYRRVTQDTEGRPEMKSFDMSRRFSKESKVHVLHAAHHHSTHHTAAPQGARFSQGASCIQWCFRVNLLTSRLCPLCSLVDVDERVRLAADETSYRVRAVIPAPFRVFSCCS